MFGFEANLAGLGVDQVPRGQPAPVPEVRGPLDERSPPSVALRTAADGATLQPQYAYPKGVPTLTGYQVTNTITTTLRNSATRRRSRSMPSSSASGDAVEMPLRCTFFLR